MARPTKTQQQTKVRAEKAAESLSGIVAGLIKKHSVRLFGGEVKEAAISIVFTDDGKASAVLRYHTTIQEGATGELDDGQEDLPLTGGAGEKGADEP